MPSTSTPSFLTAFFLTVWKLSIDFFIQQRPKGKKCWETILDVVLLWSYSNCDLRKGTKCICRSSVPFLFLSSFFFPPTLCLCDLDIQIEMVIFTLYLFIYFYFKARPGAFSYLFNFAPANTETSWMWSLGVMLPQTSASCLFPTHLFRVNIESCHFPDGNRWLPLMFHFSVLVCLDGVQSSCLWP